MGCMGAPVLMLLLIAQARDASQEPPVPYIDRGACPFECCQYGDWVATRGVLAREFYDEHRPGLNPPRRLFVLEPGAHVLAMTGVVVTTRARRMRVPEPLLVVDFW